MNNPMFADYIKVYDDMGLEDFADECVDMFENDIERSNYFDTEYRRCQIYDVIDSNSIVFNRLKVIVRSVLDRYKMEINNRNLNFLQAIEAPSLVRYLPSSDNNNNDGKNFFHSHSDNWNISTATRQLSIIMYLNDVDEGGATTFTDLNISVTPKRGRVLVFPSFYTYPHRGEEPISNNKYILISWIHFGGTGHAYRVHPLY